MFRLREEIEGLKAFNLQSGPFKFGKVPREVRTGGGADAHIFTAAGKACVNLASGMSKVHTEDEYIAAADVDAMSDLTVALLHAAAS